MSNDILDNLVTAEDDNFHPLPRDDPWQTETCWFSFNVPERKLAGWLYAWVRPNLNNCGGGVFLYDPSGVSVWEQPYFQYQYCQPLPAERDLRDFQFPNNYAVKMLEPLKRYRMHYADREHLTVDLEGVQMVDSMGIGLLIQANNSVSKAGGTFKGHAVTPLVAYGAQQMLEGPAHEGMVVLAFPDKDAALGWYDSPAYREAREHRFSGADYQVTLVEGLS